jgi:hypothetical protein
MPELSSVQMDMIRDSSSGTEELDRKIKLLTDDVTYHTIKIAMERAYSDLRIVRTTEQDDVIRIVKDYPTPVATVNLENYYYDRIIYGEQRGGGLLKKRRSKKRKSKRRKSKRRKTRRRRTRRRR